MDKKEVTIHNLKLLIAHWQQLNFDPVMMYFGGISSVPRIALNIGRFNNCGSNCCPIGIAPEVKGLEIQDADFRNGLFCYFRYSARIFPALYTKDLDNWDYLFSDVWPDDRDAFIKRAKALIDADLKFTKEMREEIETLTV